MRGGKRLFGLSFLITIVFIPHAVLAQTAELVKNIEISAAKEFTSNIGALDNFIYFSVNDPNVGRELYRSDGTAGGTGLFSDLNPGTTSSSPFDFTLVTQSGKKLLFFTASTDALGEELWRTDGTPAGTFPIDIESGDTGSNPRFLTAFGDKLLFAATTSNEGEEVFISDGTLAGTSQISTSAPGIDSGFFDSGGSPEGFIVINPELPTRKAFYLGLDPSSAQFFSTQGTSATTIKVTNLSSFALGTNSAGYTGNTAVGIYFNAVVDFAIGLELYRLDPQTSVVSLAADVTPLSNESSNPQDIAILGNKIIFTASTAELGRELYVATSGVQGATLLSDLTPGPDPSFDTFSFTNRIVSVGSHAYFSPDGSKTDSLRVFSTDGTTAGTKPILTNARGSFSNNKNLQLGLGGHVLFIASSTSIGTELFQTDGSAESTVELTDIFPGTGSGVLSFLNFNSSNFILGNTPTNLSLFSNNGTPNGTVEVKKLLTPKEGNSTPSFQFDGVNNKSVFQATTNERGTELYSTDGTESGTQLLKDIFPGERGSSLRYIATLPEKIIFLATDPTSGTEPWFTEGSPAGTKLIKDILPGIKSSSLLFANFKNVKINNSTSLFVAEDGVHGLELWKSDGTEAGTAQVKDINPGITDAFSRGGNGPQGASLIGKAVFTAADSTNNSEPWVSDGTEAGTNLLLEINPGANPSNPANYLAFNNKIFFSAAAPAVGRQIWSTDGTSVGTTMLTSLNPPNGISFSTPVALGDRIYFTNSTTTEGTEPWVTDGTSAGTKLLKDINPGTPSSFPRNFFLFNGKIYFTATSLNIGEELWVTDGTAANTLLFKDLNPGAASSSVSGFSIANGKLYFHAAFGEKTFLYESDGTPEGTVPVVNSSNSVFSGSTFFNRGTLLFPAFDQNLGIELFKIVFDACPDDPLKVKIGTCGCGVADVDSNSNGIIDCNAAAELKLLLTNFSAQLNSLRKARGGKISKKQKIQINSLKKLLTQLTALAANPSFPITTKSGANISSLILQLSALSKKTLKIRFRNFSKFKRNTIKNVQSVLNDIQA